MITSPAMRMLMAIQRRLDFLSVLTLPAAQFSRAKRQKARPPKPAGEVGSRPGTWAKKVIIGSQPAGRAYKC